MLNIDSLYDVPDFEYIVGRLGESLSKGVKISDGDESQQYIERKAELKEKMLSVYGITKPLSVKQVTDYALQNLTSDIINYCLKDRVLSVKQEDLGKVNDSEFIADLREYRKLHSKTMRYKKRSGELVYPKASLGSTNRIYYSNPNIISYPKEAFNCLDGEYLISADVKNQEPLIWNEIMGFKEFRKFFCTEKGFYVELFNHMYKREGTKEELSEFKTCWLSAMYGSNLREHSTKLISLDPLVEYFERDTVKKARDRFKKTAYTRQRKCTTYFGTILKPSGNAKVNNVFSALNMPIQGTASDIMAILLKHCYTTLDNSISVYFTRFDEIIFRVSDTVPKEEALKYIKELTSHRVDDWVPFDVDVEVIGGV